MKELWAKFKEWWMGLASREKKAISIGGPLFLLFIVYQWIWTPYLHYVQVMRERIASDQKTLSWMQSADKEMQSVESKTIGNNKIVSPVELLSQMQKQIQHGGLEQALTQLKQAANDSIEVHFQKVEFDKLIKFLVIAIKNYHVSISQMALVAVDTPGHVNADIVMKQV